MLEVEVEGRMGGGRAGAAGRSPGGGAVRPASGAGPFGFFGSVTEMGLIGMGGNGF